MCDDERGVFRVVSGVVFLVARNVGETRFLLQKNLSSERSSVGRETTETVGKRGGMRAKLYFIGTCEALHLLYSLAHLVRSILLIS